MNAVLEDALVNWYEVERSARWWAADPKYNDVVPIGNARHKTIAALDGLFRAVEIALGEARIGSSRTKRPPRAFAGAATELAWLSEVALPASRVSGTAHGWVCSP